MITILVKMCSSPAGKVKVMFAQKLRESRLDFRAERLALSLQSSTYIRIAKRAIAR